MGDATEDSAAGPADALARTKALLNESLGAELQAQLRAEKDSFIAGVTGPEFAEGVSAFVEKRPARFPRRRGSFPARVARWLPRQS